MYLLDESKVEIDSESLQKQISDKKITHASIQRKLCRSNGYMNSILKRGWATRQFCAWVEKELDIPMQTFVKSLQPKKEPEPEPVKKPNTTVSVSYKKLYQIIYEATYKAMCDALNGCGPDNQAKAVER
jgi:hypothetical protein